MYLIHFIGYVLDSDVWCGIRNLLGLGLVGLLSDLLPPPPLLVHALFPPQQLAHVCPASWCALLEAGRPEREEKNEILRLMAKYLADQALLRLDNIFSRSVFFLTDGLKDIFYYAFN